MNVETQILELLLHLRTLKAGQCRSRSDDSTATGKDQAMADVPEIPTSGQG
ncbi:hypothetical protein [Nonomuraea sp. JJY05]|uniref:hypothetical protein n=1 Tax=Nonomuraea sp. JJY05 TaxID=3350255 RepID=UPI00373EFE66